MASTTLPCDLIKRAARSVGAVQLSILKLYFYETHCLEFGLYRYYQIFPILLYEHPGKLQVCKNTVIPAQAGIQTERGISLIA